MSGKRPLSAEARAFQKFYKLSRAEAEVAERIMVVVDEALEQFDKGYAVDVESLIVTETRRVLALAAASPVPETQ